MQMNFRKQSRYKTSIYVLTACCASNWLYAIIQQSTSDSKTFKLDVFVTRHIEIHKTIFSMQRMWIISLFYRKCDGMAHRILRSIIVGLVVVFPMDWSGGWCVCSPMHMFCV